ncbi:MAG: S-methyl-5-thioribose-1-phosphate isomerase [Oligoflexales bacterium]|nr:S-methyl-5-thioribose-1-phosphate isomerase [Oligoflexales bacterium]
MFSPLSYQKGTLKLIDQRLLPVKSEWISCTSLESVAVAIETMVVRGAPAIGCTAAYGLAIDARNSKENLWLEYEKKFMQACQRLSRTRPTAVNLFGAINQIKRVASRFEMNTPMSIAADRIESEAEAIFQNDIQTCHAIGKNGLELVKNEKITVLTHCNAGALATAGYGTALGVIRSLHDAGMLEHVYADETRPYLQGSRLTSFELWEDGIPVTLNVDSAAGYIMANKKIDWVVVGADRIAANGDTANKVGTYNLAVLAKYHNVAFYVAAPLTTFDLSITSGSGIPVEMRDSMEISHIFGSRIAPEGINILNPSFDVTPHNLITGIITEHGVLRPPYTDTIARLFDSQNVRR